MSKEVIKEEVIKDEDIDLKEEDLEELAGGALPYSPQKRNRGLSDDSRQLIKPVGERL